jgi:hypothetical protein
VRRGDPRQRLHGERPAELGEQQELIVLGLGVAIEGEFAPNVRFSVQVDAVSFTGLWSRVT